MKEIKKEGMNKEEDCHMYFFETFAKEGINIKEIKHWKDDSFYSQILWRILLILEIVIHLINEKWY